MMKLNFFKYRLEASPMNFFINYVDSLSLKKLFTFVLGGMFISFMLSMGYFIQSIYNIKAENQQFKQASLELITKIEKISALVQNINENLGLCIYSDAKSKQNLMMLKLDDDINQTIALLTSISPSILTTKEQADSLKAFRKLQIEIEVYTHYSGAENKAYVPLRESLDASVKCIHQLHVNLTDRHIKRIDDVDEGLQFFIVRMVLFSVIIFLFTGLLIFSILRSILRKLGDEPDEILKVAYETMEGIDYFDEEPIEKKNHYGFSKEILTIINNIRQKEATLHKEIEKNSALIHQQNQEIIYKNRAAAMGEMIANIAHQWRQPLQVIGMTLVDAQFDLEEFEVIDKENGEKLISAIESQIGYLSKTIDDFRNFFDPKKEKRNFALDQVISYTVGLVKQKMLQLNIKIIIEYENTPSVDSESEPAWETKIQGYPGELSQVLLNLISNAKDVLIDKNITNSTIIVFCVRNGNFIGVGVRDNGGGIPETVLPKIFEPYFTTKHQKQGTGIGLYMSRVIVEEHHKGILSAANDSEGAVFTMKLPIEKGVE